METHFLLTFSHDRVSLVKDAPTASKLQIKLERAIRGVREVSGLSLPEAPFLPEISAYLIFAVFKKKYLRSEKPSNESQLSTFFWCYEIISRNRVAHSNTFPIILKQLTFLWLVISKYFVDCLASACITLGWLNDVSIPMEKHLFPWILNGWGMQTSYMGVNRLRKNIEYRWRRRRDDGRRLCIRAVTVYIIKLMRCTVLHLTFPRCFMAIYYSNVD